MALSHAADLANTDADRVRRVTPPELNEQIDRQTDINIRRYSGGSTGAILNRIEMLDREWDIDRVLEVNGSVLALTGLMLGLTLNRKWLLLPAIVLPLLVRHGLQGRCPPLPLLRRLGFRTRGEIDREKFELLSLI